MTAADSDPAAGPEGGALLLSCLNLAAVVIVACEQAPLMMLRGPRKNFQRKIAMWNKPVLR
jgi:hypothetical protein